MNGTAIISLTPPPHLLSLVECLFGTLTFSWDFMAILWAQKKTISRAWA